jgi:predicted DNA-binding transcriptional regulator YafY
MRGDLLALQAQSHSKAQRAPREIFRLLLSFLDIFLTPSHSIRKTIKGFSAKPPLRPLRLCVRNEKIWHESQKITKLLDGGIELTFKVAGIDEIKRWVLSLGPEALVLEPKRLQEMVQKDLAGTWQQYREKRSIPGTEIRETLATI